MSQKLYFGLHLLRSKVRVINSRPLTHNSTDVSDFAPLTPNHFLLGRANHPLMPCNVTDTEICSRKRSMAPDSGDN